MILDSAEADYNIPDVVVVVAEKLTYFALEFGPGNVVVAHKGHGQELEVTIQTKTIAPAAVDFDTLVRDRVNVLASALPGLNVVADHRTKIALHQLQFHSKTQMSGDSQRVRFLAVRDCDQ